MNTKIITIPLIAALTALAAGSVVAGSDCKGLSRSACQGSASCSWVNGYTRQDGREVAAYCRVKSAGKSAARPDAKAAPKS